MQKKALIIDDTKNIRLLLAKCLELDGWEVASARDGKEGLDMIYSQQYDLIFLDIKLPEISGTEILRRMRSSGIQVPVIVITAYPTIKNAVEGVMQKKALIIDDTKNIRLLLAKCLELDGWEVSSARDGKEGLDMIYGQQYDLIFLDIKLPEISGTEILRRIRSSGILVPVIVITAYPTIKNAVDCTRLGVVSYLQKPFTAERLRMVLKDLNIAGSQDERSDLKTSVERALLDNDTARAGRLLREALAEDPSDGSIYMMLSQVHAAMGDAENAEKFLKVYEIFKIGG